MIEWSELEQLTFSIDQAIKILFIGTQDLENGQRYKEDEQMYEKCDYVVDWLIPFIGKFIHTIILFLKKPKPGTEYLEQSNHSAKHYIYGNRKADYSPD